jgi:hypothetical protein
MGPDDFIVRSEPPALRPLSRPPVVIDVTGEDEEEVGSSRRHDERRHDERALMGSGGRERDRTPECEQVISAAASADAATCIP